jgi:hypothetical protein
MNRASDMRKVCRSRHDREVVIAVAGLSATHDVRPSASHQVSRSVAGG